MDHSVLASPPVSVWAIGTESQLVRRLAKENPEKVVLSLSDPLAFCRTMSLARREDLAANSYRALQRREVRG